MKNIVIVGNGKWSQKIQSSLNQFSDINFFVANRENWKLLINQIPDGVIVATPPDSHIKIASFALNKNIPCFIEKPLALSLKDAQILSQFKAPILVNHIHLFSDAYQNIKSFVKDKQITKIKLIGTGQAPLRDYSVLWDYGCHDIAMMLDLMQEMPFKTKTQHGDKYNWDVDFYFDSAVCNMYAGQDFPRRSIEVSFDGITVSYNDKERPLHHNQPLMNSLRVFFNAIDGIQDSRLGIDLSLKVIQVLEMIKW